MTKKIFSVAKKIVAVMEKIFFLTKTIVAGAEKIFSVANTIVPIAEKIFSAAQTMVSVMKRNAGNAGTGYVIPELLCGWQIHLHERQSSFPSFPHEISTQTTEYFYGWNY